MSAQRRLYQVTNVSRVEASSPDQALEMVRSGDPSVLNTASHIDLIASVDLNPPPAVVSFGIG